MGTENFSLKVMMLPWLAYGHISPFLELAKRLSRRDIQTYLCSTPVNLNSIRDKIPGRYSKSLHLVELYLPTSPELPPQYHTTNGLPLHLNPTLKKALDLSKTEFSRILEALRPDLLIHDVMVQWPARLAFSNDIPVVSFLTSGATMCSYFVHSLMTLGGAEYPFPAIRLAGVELDMVNGYVESERKKGQERDPDDGEIADRGSRPVVMLINSSRGIEGKYIDYLSEIMEWKIMPVGPLVCTSSVTDKDQSHHLMEWLDRKEAFSTVYLSFGSEYFLKREDIEEIACGLELSNVNFMWVIRFPAGEEIGVEDALPSGFLERIGERGKVVERWAPQGKILGHPSVGGFVSHCGWNSFMESIEFGVPIIAMPMQLDQPLNAKLVVELGVGVGVGRDEKGRFKREEIGKVIRDVLVGEKGGILRRRVWEQREVLRGKGEQEMDELVQEVAQLCGKQEMDKLVQEVAQLCGKSV